MKERPILFKGAMVQALLAGRKTQTRRILKLPKGLPTSGAFWDHRGYRAKCPAGGDGWTFGPKDLPENMVSVGAPVFTSPYGGVGDRLWVKETFAPCHEWRNEPKFAATMVDYIYRADYTREPDRIVRPHYWKPSIFCTRKASRITLEIVSVRAERLNDISEADAIAEGVEAVRSPDMLSIFTTKGYACDIAPNYIHGVPKVGDDWGGQKVTHVVPNPGSLLDTAKDSYRKLWEKINGACSWAKNPWVWVVEFRRVEK